MSDTTEARPKPAQDATGANVTDAVSMLWNGTTAYLSFAEGS